MAIASNSSVTEANLQQLRVYLHQYYKRKNIPVLDQESKAAQEAYQIDSRVKQLADQIMSDNMYMVGVILKSPAIKRFYSRNGLCTREELKTVGAVGLLMGKGDTYGGLLGAILRAGEQYEYPQFEQFAYTKIKGAMIDYVRARLGKSNDPSSKPKIVSLTNRDGELVEPDGYYFGLNGDNAIAAQDIRILERAAERLAEPHRTVIMEFLDNIAASGDVEVIRRARKDKASNPLLKPAITALKFAYCQLDDDELPSSFVKLKYAFRNSKNLEELAANAYAIAEAAGLNQEELAAGINISHSIISTQRAKGKIPGEVLPRLGIRREDLPVFSIPFFPELWSDEYLEQRKQLLIATNDSKIFAQALKAVLRAESLRHPDRVKKYCGENNVKVRDCLRQLNDEKWPSGNEAIIQLGHILDACGLSDQTIGIAVMPPEESSVSSYRELAGKKRFPSKPKRKEADLSMSPGEALERIASGELSGNRNLHNLFCDMQGSARDFHRKNAIALAAKSDVNLGTAIRMLRVASGQSPVQLAKALQTNTMHVETMETTIGCPPLAERFLELNPLDLSPEEIDALRSKITAKAGYVNRELIRNQSSQSPKPG